jgi:hypothetical protein
MNQEADSHQPGEIRMIRKRIRPQLSWHSIRTIQGK